ncbi:MAG TPA: Flp pilus assembly protein CpaB [Actinomycetota bacterium]|nr:Flp pilus assembly protein CpaB [Actinomycetota bacterium]
MQSRSTVIIGAGVAVALLGAILVFVYAHNLQGSAGASNAPGEASFVVTTAIPVGTQSSAISGDVKQVGVQASARPADAITSINQISGLVALRPLEVGEVVTTSDFGTAGTPSTNTSGLAIPAGDDAISVNVSLPQDAAGYVSPGDQIDIYVSSKDLGNANAVRLMLANVTVLATVVEGTPTAAAPAAASGPETWTLALSPVDATKVIFAESFESVWFGLVHPGNPPAPSAGTVGANLYS